MRLSRKQVSDIYCSGIQVINPFKINKIMKKKSSFNQVWDALMKRKKLKVSDVLPKKWFTIDSPSQLKLYKKKN